MKRVAHLLCYLPVRAPRCMHPTPTNLQNVTPLILIFAPVSKGAVIWLVRKGPQMLAFFAAVHAEETHAPFNHGRGGLRASSNTGASFRRFTSTPCGPDAVWLGPTERWRLA